MDNKTEKKKVFLEIVKQLRELIQNENIVPGDKLPSERVLSEMLGVGRSSVREALRSLELLGLIETTHGGGTFLATVQHHHLVEILASFILTENNSTDEVHAIRMMHEKEAIQIICSHNDIRTLPVWESLFIKIEVGQDVVRDHILREFMIASGNRIALKIWLQLAAYSANSLKKVVTREEKKNLQMLLKSIQLGFKEEALETYKRWMDFLKIEKVEQN